MKIEPTYSTARVKSFFKRNYEVVSNVGWLFFDKVFTKGLMFLLFVWMARYLGSEEFGVWNYAISYTSIIGILSSVGLNSLVIKRIVQNPQDTNSTLGTAWTLKIFGALLSLILGSAIILIIQPDNKIVQIAVFILLLSYLFRTFEIIDLFNQAILRTKYTVLARNSAVLISSSLYVCFVFNQFSLIYFLAVNSLEYLFFAIFLILFYSFKQKFRVLDWRFENKTAKYLLTRGTPLILAEFAVLIYMRIDQIMIGEMLGQHEVGIYSAAVTISEIGFLFPFVITRGIFPKILSIRQRNLKDYYSALQKAFLLMAILGVTVSLVVSLIARNIITSFYGLEYIESARILSIHVWSGIFAFMGFVATMWFNAEHLEKLILYKTIFGAITNVILNFYLIEQMGVEGAALSTFFAQLMAAYFFNLLFKRTRIIFKMQSMVLLNVLTLGIFTGKLNER